MNWLKIALANFFAAAVLGVLLRFAFVEELSWLKYSHFLHAHSHVAMLGWVFAALFALLVFGFLAPEKRKKPVYQVLFGINQLCVIGMLLTFPIQGYAGGSIAFSTLHIFVTYAFAWVFFRDLRRQYPGRVPLSGRMAYAALGFLVLSSVGLWAMAPIIMLELKRTIWYYLAVQFYLHFQFNGWFLFAVFGLLFKVLENKGISLPKKPQRWFFPILLAATFLTFALAVAWSNPHPAIFLVNSLGVILQLNAGVFLALMLWPNRNKWLAPLPPWTRVLLKLALLGFGLKVLVQTLVVIPAIATVAYTLRNFVIGFIHLLLLGTITPFLLGLASHFKMLDSGNRWFGAGVVVFLAGFLLSELVLFVQGMMFWGTLGFMPYYYELLFAVSCLLPVGVGLLLISSMYGDSGLRSSGGPEAPATNHE